jgi:hypothetical protein
MSIRRADSGRAKKTVFRVAFGGSVRTDVMLTG